MANTTVNKTSLFLGLGNSPSSKCQVSLYLMEHYTTFLQKEFSTAKVQISAVTEARECKL